VFGVHTTFNSDIIINAESGAERLAEISTGTIAGFQNAETAGWWSNTVDSVSSIQVKCSSATAQTGTVKLYRRVNPTTTGDTLNFEVVEVVDISGDFSAGHTFSGLTGDSTTLYKVEFLGSCASGSVGLRGDINSDLTSNYPNQYFQGTSSTTVAGSNTLSFLNFGNVTVGQTRQVMYIYPKSGASRPMLTEWAEGENLVRFQSMWWGNTVDEVADIEIHGTSTTVITGTLKLSRLI